MPLKRVRWDEIPVGAAFRWWRQAGQACHYVKVSEAYWCDDEWAERVQRVLACCPERPSDEQYLALPSLAAMGGDFTAFETAMDNCLAWLSIREPDELVKKVFAIHVP